MGKRTRPSAKQMEQLAAGYFSRCRQERSHPSLPGLALALGFASRRELEQAQSASGPAGEVLRRAVTRVEEATLQSAFTKDLAASAKFILQNGFGYAEKAAQPPPEEIRVLVEEPGEEGTP